MSLHLARMEDPQEFPMATTANSVRPAGILLGPQELIPTTGRHSLLIVANRL
jgi:hypothetical protein